MNESTTTESMKRADNISLALGEPAIHIQQIIPWLLRRHAAAKDWMISHDESVRENAKKDIEYINDNIKNLLGL